MSTPQLAIRPGTPGAQLLRAEIADHQRRARDNTYLARRVLEVANTDPRVDDPARLMRLARLLDQTAIYHAKKARTHEGTRNIKRPSIL